MVVEIKNRQMKDLATKQPKEEWSYKRVPNPFPWSLNIMKKIEIVNAIKWLVVLGMPLAYRFSYARK